MNFSESNIISLIDLTRLTDNDDVVSVAEFCRGAETPLGHVAAMCVYPEFIITAKEILAETEIPIATVANFPGGDDSLDDTLKSIEESLQDGAHEIDVVLPYRQFMSGEHAYAINFLEHCRAATQGVVLKVILESGALSTEDIALATSIVAACGANFVKTSTGKIEQGATLADVETILQTLSTLENPPGIKISGGVRTPDQARAYLMLIGQYMGESWVNPNNVRIGASQLLKQLLPADA
jgi:deoxyribose-phosphate aldolase